MYACTPPRSAEPTLSPIRSQIEEKSTRSSTGEPPALSRIDAPLPSAMKIGAPGNVSMSNAPVPVAASHAAPLAKPQRQGKRDLPKLKSRKSQAGDKQPQQPSKSRLGHCASMGENVLVAGNGANRPTAWNKPQQPDGRSSVDQALLDSILRGAKRRPEAGSDADPFIVSQLQAVPLNVRT